MALLSNSCPKCQKGPILYSYVKIYPSCPACGHAYMAAEGSFTGALFINYSILSLSVFPTLIFGLGIMNWEPVLVGMFCMIQMLVLSPFTLRMSRILWVKTEAKS